MPDRDRNTTSGREPEIRSKRSIWKPIYDEFPLSLPQDWRCPCGTLLVGNKSCPSCGRVPRDHVSTPPKPDPIRMRQWRKFGKSI